MRRGTSDLIEDEAASKLVLFLSRSTVAKGILHKL
jgi:hypothetical protein